MISHISVKNLPPKKKHSATPQNVGISCVTPPTTWWWCLIKNTLYFGKPITKTFLFPSWWSWEGGVPLISPPPSRCLVDYHLLWEPRLGQWCWSAGCIIECGWYTYLGLLLLKKRWTIKIDLLRKSKLLIEFIGLWLNLGWWMIWICLVDIQLKPNLPSACWCCSGVE